MIKRDKSGVGYRVIDEEEVGRFPADLLQVTIYKGWPRAVDRMRRAAEACRRLAVPFVVHPVDYCLSETDPRKRAEMMADVRIMAKETDVALILHDETLPDGTRISGEREKRYSEVLEEVSGLCPISIENSANSRDIPWFWKRYATSITLDIGHLEAAGIDSAAFVDEEYEQLLEKLDFVHIHHVGAYRKGIVDHWPLAEGCKELGTLDRLLRTKRSVGIILELIETDVLKDNLRLVRKAIESG